MLNAFDQSQLRIATAIDQSQRSIAIAHLDCGGRECDDSARGGVRPKLPALEGEVGEAECGEAEDAEVHRLEGEGLLALVEGDAVEAGRGPVRLLLVPAHDRGGLEPERSGGEL